jgi:hypothetical protein
MLAVTLSQSQESGAYSGRYTRWRLRHTITTWPQPWGAATGVEIKLASARGSTFYFTNQPCLNLKAYWNSPWPVILLLAQASWRERLPCPDYLLPEVGMIFFRPDITPVVCAKDSNLGLRPA